MSFRERPRGPGGRMGGGMGMGMGMRGRKRECEFTKLGIIPDYKDVKRLQKYITVQGKILPRRRTGVTAKMQRRLSIAIKRARHLALLPSAPNHTRS